MKSKIELLSCCNYNCNCSCHSFVCPEAARTAHPRAKLPSQLCLLFLSSCSRKLSLRSCNCLQSVAIP